MGEWIDEWRNECSVVSKMMAILSLLLCGPSACSMQLLSRESSDWDLSGVILENHAKFNIVCIHLANINWINEKRKVKKSFQTFFEGFIIYFMSIKLHSNNAEYSAIFRLCIISKSTIFEFWSNCKFLKSF